LEVSGRFWGDQLGYWFGKKTGPALFTREDSFLFHKDNLIKAEQFYKKHGKKTIVLARYIAYVRMFAPMLAGAGKMHYPTFLAYNIIGGITWVVSLSVLGYTLGQVIPNIERYVFPIIIAVIAISSIPVVYAGIKSYLRKK
jgi:membrane-associated protein